MTGDDTVNIEEFMEAYPALALPFTYGDTSFPARENDSLRIAPEILHQFIPDSVTLKVFGAASHPNYYPVGTVAAGHGEFYLLTRGVDRERKVLLITAHDSKKQFIAGLPAIKLTRNTNVSITVTIDQRLNINKDLSQKLPNGIEISGHDVFVLNKAAKNFSLIMTDSLGDGFTELINPIDTLARRQKYAGDYGDGKMNLVSFRDGQREGRMRFFIHLEKNNKECVGELKGDVIFSSPTVAEYRQGGDPCVLRFIFDKNSVSLEEVEGCGSRLGALQCSFNGEYPRRAPSGNMKRPIKNKK
ncbi:hypothetical protein SAMN04487894_101417 [Niabella drilacis]|uniref:Uncharacterized protein n=2 Tax=Niabella drilacis (strain DSM 25811 / CCM 8410 / CCUG 62505 / LMG 26954 / E90) TaxID=1285928 RepID=A0A1G6J5L8_NIADE|nr:hypothetical protein SAMN04487894_101417 [Niabella drilacis]